ncbi:hypothetical protein J4573_31580 [Actinomadura barringtoniae]|uniref:Uncharacterized protein n=1 Tax=Actinomadura barringtoniae TaxID=1427535 RepID=A0A939PM39_9ACTN|nr:T3SS effector HopA1 family protein [Actinomadura barringtoniae]MBO2451669.1 hypothetical protein [Actinomadura barringtoniae]
MSNGTKKNKTKTKTKKKPAPKPTATKTKTTKTKTTQTKTTQTKTAGKTPTSSAVKSTTTAAKKPVATRVAERADRPGVIKVGRTGDRTGARTGRVPATATSTTATRARSGAPTGEVLTRPRAQGQAEPPQAFERAAPRGPRMPPEGLTDQAKTFLARQRALKALRDSARQQAQAIPVPDTIPDTVPDIAPPPPPSPPDDTTAEPVRPVQTVDTIEDVVPPPPPPETIDTIVPPPPPPLPPQEELDLTGVRPVPITGDGVKTKRQLMSVTASRTDEVLIKQGLDANKAALQKIYDAFYKDGRKQSGAERLNNIYNMMGEGTAEYVQTKVTAEQFDKFIKTRNDVFIKPQGVETPSPFKDRAKYEESLTDELEGDSHYFHVNNYSKKFQDAHKKGRYEGLGKLARRIIVNVKTQEAGLRVADKLYGLMDDDLVSPNMREFKIFLSDQDPPPKGVKNDKLVVYYQLPPGTTDDTVDTVGDKIVATIGDAVTDDDLASDLSPFYARVGNGVAYAEEPKYFVGELDNSFTETRAQVISDVIKSNDEIPDLATFTAKLSTALRDKFIDPDQPHRHLPGAKSLEQVRAEKEAAVKPQLDAGTKLLRQKYLPRYNEALKKQQEVKDRAEERRQRLAATMSEAQLKNPAFLRQEEVIKKREDFLIKQYQDQMDGYNRDFGKDITALRRKLGLK